MDRNEDDVSVVNAVHFESRLNNGPVVVYTKDEIDKVQIELLRRIYAKTQGTLLMQVLDCGVSEKLWVLIENFKTKCIETGRISNADIESFCIEMNSNNPSEVLDVLLMLKIIQFPQANAGTTNTVATNTNTITTTNADTATVLTDTFSANCSAFNNNDDYNSRDNEFIFDFDFNDTDLLVDDNAIQSNDDDVISGVNFNESTIDCVTNCINLTAASVENLPTTTKSPFVCSYCGIIFDTAHKLDFHANGICFYADQSFVNCLNVFEREVDFATTTIDTSIGIDSITSPTTAGSSTYDITSSTTTDITSSTTTDITSSTTDDITIATNITANTPAMAINNTSKIIMKREIIFDDDYYKATTLFGNVDEASDDSKNTII